MAASSSSPAPLPVPAHAPCWEEVIDDGHGDDDGVDDDDDDEFDVPYCASLSAALADAARSVGSQGPKVQKTNGSQDKMGPQGPWAHELHMGTTA